MPITSHYRQRCPLCSGGVRRVRRSSRESRDESGQDLRRYRCTEQGCGWQGMLPRLARRVRRGGAATGESPWRVWLVPVALLALIAIGVAALSIKAMQA